MENDPIPIKEQVRELVLMRGLPGSGKSTKAKKIAGERGVIYSTDDFFMVNGEYKYNPKMIVEYHENNFKRTVQAMREGKPLIIIDNTNIKLWQMRKYVLAGQEHGYKIRIEEADTPWAFNFRQCAKRNTHGVPQDSCKKMRDNYQICKSIEQIKNAKR